VASIPIVNLAAFLDGSGREQQALARDVDAICRNTGFLIVEQHGVPARVVDAAWSAVRDFFDLPLSEKLRARSPDPGCPRGYFPLATEALAKSLGVETPPDIKESFGVGPLQAPPRAMSDAEFAFHYGPNIWPQQPPELRGALTDYFTELHALGTRLLRLFAAALSLPHDYFEQFHTAPMCALRCLNYPANHGPLLENQRGAGEHADYGSITILKSDPAVPGLEIRLRSGEWVAAPLVRDGFIVNIGDMMARWTNDRWVSTMHRVISPAQSAHSPGRRQSMAFFHNASFDADIRCIDTCRDASQPARYAPVQAGQYLATRFNSALADQP
jgi:isopenicillin N synthase-like dioxygenase